MMANRDQRTFKKMDTVELMKMIKILQGCYNRADFVLITDFLAEDVIYESQWVFNHMTGKSTLLHYFEGKMATMKRFNTPIEAKIIILKAPGRFMRALKGPVTLLYPDGEPCLIITQIDTEKREAILRIKLDVEGQIARMDLCMPQLFEWEELN